LVSTVNLLNNELFQVILLTILMALLAVFSARQAAMARMAALQKTQEKIYVIEVCNDNERRREFREGDYVGKVVKECEGGKKAIIKAIYVEAPKIEKKSKSGGLFKI